jgi:hypothetical protein
MVRGPTVTEFQHTFGINRQSKAKLPPLSLSAGNFFPINTQA